MTDISPYHRPQHAITKFTPCALFCAPVTVGTRQSAIAVNPALSKCFTSTSVPSLNLEFQVIVLISDIIAPKTHANRAQSFVAYKSNHHNPL